LKFLLLTIFITVSGSALLAQDGSALKWVAVGVEAQAYPAGFIIGARSDMALSERISVNLRLGYNFARRRDLGEHDDERGGGPGFSVGGRYYFKPGFEGFFAGARFELWIMDIDWEDIVPNGDIRSGNTEITVVQPLVEGGYTFLLADGSLAVTPKITLGYEINAKTKGEDVGQGSISLIGVTVTKRF